MTTENLLDQVSIRNLKEGGTPLRRFKGKFDSYTLDPITGSTKMRVNLNFTEVEVKDSTEPYQFPIAQIGISHSLSQRSGWGIFSKSLVQFLKEDQDIKDAVGMTMELAMTPNHIYGKNQEGEDITGNVWEVASVEGAGPKVNPIEKALEILDGKQESAFNQAVFNEPALKGTDVLSAILNKTFVKTVLEMGQATVDADGTYHRVKSEGQPY